MNDSSSDVNFAQIYKYLASVVVNDEEQPPLNPESAACLVDALEDLEKQAALVVNKELEEELNDAYCTLLMNLRKPPKALAKTAESKSIVFVFIARRIGTLSHLRKKYNAQKCM